MYKILVEPEAIIDINSICEYYESLDVNSSQITHSFITEIEIAFNSLSINPKYQIRYKNYRAFPLIKFPYLLFFTVNENNKTVYVISIFNTHQNPKKYPK